MSLCHKSKIIFYLCNLICSLSPFLDLNVLSQEVQGMETPSRWFASMWSLMLPFCPSLPQTVHVYRYQPPTALFSLFVIIGLTCSSSSWTLVMETSETFWFVSATLLSIFLSCPKLVFNGATAVSVLTFFFGTRNGGR